MDIKEWLRKEEEELGFSAAGMAEVLGVHLETYLDMRSPDHHLLPGQAVIDGIACLDEIRRLKGASIVRSLC